MANTCIITGLGQALLTYNLSQDLVPLINLTSIQVGDAAGVTPSGSEVSPYGVLNYVGDTSNIIFRQSQSPDILALDIVLPQSDTDAYAVGNIVIYTDTGVAFAILALGSGYNKTSRKVTFPIQIAATGISTCFDQSVQTDTRNMLDSMFQPLSTWDELGQSTNAVLQANVVEPRNQLLQLRNPDYFDRTLANYTAKMLGAKFFSDNFDDAAIERLTRYITLYWSRKGTVDFINLLSFLKNTHFTVTQLWTADFISFAPTPGGSTIVTGGSFYPSSHFAIEYNLTDYPLVGGSSAAAEQEITTLYYNIAPITHVIDSITGLSTPTPGALYLAAASFNSSVSYSSNF